MSSAPLFDPEQACGECGRLGAYGFDGENLCVDCYQQRGSCCAEREVGAETPTDGSSPTERDRS